MNLATIIVLLIVLGMVVLAIYGLHSGKGKCSCEYKEKSSKNYCPSCNANCPLKRDNRDNKIIC